MAAASAPNDESEDEGKQRHANLKDREPATALSSSADHNLVSGLQGESINCEAIDEGRLHVLLRPQNLWPSADDHVAEVSRAIWTAGPRDEVTQRRITARVVGTRGSNGAGEGEPNQRYDVNHLISVILCDPSRNTVIELEPQHASEAQIAHLVPEPEDFVGLNDESLGSSQAEALVRGDDPTTDFEITLAQTCLQQECLLFSPEAVRHARSFDKLSAAFLGESFAVTRLCG